MAAVTCLPSSRQRASTQAPRTFASWSARALEERGQIARAARPADADDAGTLHSDPARRASSCRCPGRRPCRPGRPAPRPGGGRQSVAIRLALGVPRSWRPRSAGSADVIAEFRQADDRGGADVVVAREAASLSRMSRFDGSRRSARALIRATRQAGVSAEPIACLQRRIGFAGRSSSAAPGGPTRGPAASLSARSLATCGTASARPIRSSCLSEPDAGQRPRLRPQPGGDGLGAGAPDRPPAPGGWPGRRSFPASPAGRRVCPGPRCPCPASGRRAPGRRPPPVAPASARRPASRR